MVLSLSNGEYSYLERAAVSAGIASTLALVDGYKAVCALKVELPDCCGTKLKVESGVVTLTLLILTDNSPRCGENQSQCSMMPPDIQRNCWVTELARLCPAWD